MVTQPRACSGWLFKPYRRSLGKASLLLAFLFSFNFVLPVFALKQQETTEGAGLEEISQGLKKVADLEGTVYRVPLADGAIALNSKLNPTGKIFPAGGSLRTFVPAGPGGTFLLMSFRGPAFERPLDNPYALIQLDDGTGSLSVFGRKEVQLSGMNKREREKVALLHRYLTLPASISLRTKAALGPGPGPGGSWKIPDLPITVSQEPRGLRFEITPPPIGPNEVPLLYLLFPLDRADLSESALRYYHDLSLRFLRVLRNQPSRSPVFRTLRTGSALGPSIQLAEVTLFLQNNPTGVLSIPFGDVNPVVVRPAGRGSLTLFRSEIGRLQAQLSQILTSKLQPQGSNPPIGTLVIIAADRNSREFYTDIVQKQFPRTAIVPVRSPAEIPLIAQALERKVDAVLLVDLKGAGAGGKNGSVLYKQLGVHVPTVVLGIPPVKGEKSGEGKMLADQPSVVAYASSSEVVSSGRLVDILEGLERQVIRSKTSLSSSEEAASVARQALPYLAEFRSQAAPYLAETLDQNPAGFVGLDRRIAAVEKHLRGSPPQIGLASYELRVATASLINTGDGQIPAEIKEMLLSPLQKAAGILLSTPAGVQERGPEIFAPQTIKGAVVRPPPAAGAEESAFRITVASVRFVSNPKTGVLLQEVKLNVGGPAQRRLDLLGLVVHNGILTAFRRASTGDDGPKEIHPLVTVTRGNRIFVLVEPKGTKGYDEALHPGQMERIIRSSLPDRFSGLPITVLEQTQREQVHITPPPEIKEGSSLEMTFLPWEPALRLPEEAKQTGLQQAQTSPFKLIFGPDTAGYSLVLPKDGTVQARIVTRSLEQETAILKFRPDLTGSIVQGYTFPSMKKAIAFARSQLGPDATDVRIILTERSRDALKRQIEAWLRPYPWKPASLQDALLDNVLYILGV